mgnify:CR=1 FL=1
MAGLGLTVYYLLVNSAGLRAGLGLPPGSLWWGILPVAGGVFGVPAGLLATLLVSRFTSQRQLATVPDAQPASLW